ncbi:MAG: type II toxin-antitoxin system YafQ family toxin [Pseudomonadota bacterium]
MKEIVFTRRFERDFRRLKRRLSPHVLDYETLEYVFELLQRGTPLPEAFREHALEGSYSGFTECHVDADWLLIYRATRTRIVFHRTGTHRTLFRARHI